MTLIGDCSRFLPLLIKALENGERTGLGSQRIGYELLPVELGTTEEPKTKTLDELAELPPFKNIVVSLVTPLRLRKRGVYLAETGWPFFMETVARRLEALYVLYAGGNPLGKEKWINIASMFSLAPQPSDEHLKWREYRRRSNRQRREIPMGGLVGRVVFKNPPEWFKSWLWAASLLHVGKGAAMGLGKIEISSL